MEQVDVDVFARAKREIITYRSRWLTKLECNYCVTRWELLATETFV